MFPVITRLKSKTNQDVLNILLIQSGYERYCKHFAGLENVNIYLYSPWSIPQDKTPNNVIAVSDKDSPIVGSFDKIICIGKANNLNVAEQIRKRFGMELIVVNDSSKETYCPRPFTFSIAQKTEYRADIEISMSSCLGHSELQVIPCVKEKQTTGPAKKENTICFFDQVPPTIVNGVVFAAQDSDLVQFNEQNISRSKIFLDSVVGCTPHLLAALSHGCIPIVPHCDEIERLFGGLGYIYKNYSEIAGHIKSARNDQTDKNRFREMYENCMTSKQDFTNKWNHILGRN